jgi:hypothetical protein
MEKLFLSFLPIMLLFFCKPDDQAVKVALPVKNVIIKIDTLYQTKYYSLQDSTGSYTVSVYLNELNRGVFRYRYKGTNPLQLQIEAMQTVLNTVFKDTSLHINLHTFIWGALSKSAQNDFLMSKRLVLAAAKSDAWNKKTGKPFKGHENPFVLKLANQAQIYPELSTLFRKFGYKTKVSGVEKVFIQPAEKLHFWDEISGRANKNDKLPFDCQTWFSIEKAKN